ncbi:MAG: hypothetical protein NC489_20965 [Ruminococcus flavefaciens]|nr:hypothetical protein [Ruminococcus flavefaciens]
MRKNRANLMKRYTVAIVSVSTAIPTVAPAVPAFAAQKDGDAAIEDSSAGDEDIKEAEAAALADEPDAADVSGKADEAAKDDESGKDDEAKDAGEDEDAEGAGEAGEDEEAKNADKADKADKADEDSDGEDDVLADAILEDGEVPKAAQPEKAKEEEKEEEAELETEAEAEAEEEQIGDLDLNAKTFADYPEFGSAEFVAWLADASDEDIKAWYDAASLYLGADKATGSDAEKAPLEFGSDEFWAWVYEDAAEMKGGEWLYDMDAILEWMVDAGYDEARAFIDEFFMSSDILLASAEYPEFGTAEFFAWLETATEDQVRGWHDINKKGTEDATDEQLASYALEFDSDEFWEWFQEECATVIDEEKGIFSYKYDVIYDWVCHVPFETAYQLLQFLAVDAQTSTFASIGRLWPENYGSTGDLYSDGRGTKENPYIIDSVADLRLFAATIAQNPSKYNNNDVYYLIENGTYDLNGSWIPVGGSLNPGANPTAFLGHLACESNVVIENFGFKSNTALGITPDIVNGVIDQTHVGFFAKLGAGSSVTGLRIQTDNNNIAATADYTGILAGEAVDTTIKECIVSGYVKSSYGYVGGLVGYVHSSNTADSNRGCIIENCIADEVAVWTEVAAPNGFCNGYSAVGGIAGFASNASILDTIVDTNSGTGNHIYGNAAYVGGIVGAIKNSNIINSHVESGQVGSAGSFAVGGLVGGYEGGQIKVGRFSGDIIAPSSGYNYSACFVGAAIRGHSFTYGETGDLCYLFADTKSKADKGVFGGKPADVGGTFGTDAHIGYWHAGDKGYTLISGSIDRDSADGDYFYEELERGILACIRAAGSQSAADPNLDTIDHYTCDNSGNPIRGYLLTVATPLVDGKEAANMTAYVLGNNYRKPCTATNQAAFAKGDVVYLSFQDLEDADAYYQMNTEVAQNPWYSYHNSDIFTVFEEDVDKAGVNKSGGFHFTMPASDTTVGAVYKKVSESVRINPERVVFEVTQIRTGTRERPSIEWRVTAYDADPDVSSSARVITDGMGNKWENRLVATQTQDGTLRVEPDAKFWMGSKVNGQVNSGYNLIWQFSNSATLADEAGNGLIYNLAAGYGNTAAPTASFMLNLTDLGTSAIAKQAHLLEEKQKNEGYKNSITTASPYWYHSIVTATAQVQDATDQNNPPVGTLDATIKFSIIDQTQVAVNGVALSHNNITYDVVRTLTGDRKNPTVKYTVNGESNSAAGSVSDLIATFNPDYFSKDQVNWYITSTGLEDDFADIKNEEVENVADVDDGTINLSLSPNSYKNAYVNLKGITDRSADGNLTVSGWAKDEDAKYTVNLKKNPGESHSYQKLVKVTAHDASKNSVTDTCLVTVNFHTEDQTEIMPTEVKINDDSHIYGYNIYYSFAGNTESAVTSRTITLAGGKNDVLVDGKGQTLSATVKSNGEIYDNSEESYNPYDDGVVWSIANPKAAEGSQINVNDILRIDPDTGEITVRGYSDSTDANDLGFSPWVKSLIDNKKLNGITVPVRIYATSTRDENVFDYKDINITFRAATASSEQQDGIVFDVVETKTAAKTVDGTDIVEDSVWTGNGLKDVEMTFSGVSAAPNLKIYDADGKEVKGADKILELVDVVQDQEDHQTTAKLQVNTGTTWFTGIRNGRLDGNYGTLAFTIKPDNGDADPIPVTLNYRYEGLDLSAKAIEELPQGYEATPDTISEETPEETYDVSKGTVTDRNINLKVVVTQGSKTANVEATKKWSYGIVKLDNTHYSDNGAAENTGTYVLTGDLAKYARVDSKGYLVPIKGNWEELIGRDETVGQVGGVVTCYKEEAGKLRVADSYKVTIDFRYDMAYLDQHEKTFDIVYTDKSLTVDPESSWSGLDPFKLTAHFTDENGMSASPEFKSSDEDALTIDADGNVSIVTGTWMQEIIDNAKEYGSGEFSGTRTVTITGYGKNDTKDTCVVTINFRYDQARLSSNEEEYTIIRTQTSRTNNPSHTWSELKDGAVSEIKTRQLEASMHLQDGKQTTPFWNSENTEYVTVNDAGVIAPAVDQAWQQAVVDEGRYQDSRTAAVHVTDSEGTVKDSCEVKVNYIYEDVELAKNEATLNVTLRATGMRDDAAYVVEGYELDNPAVLHSYDPDETGVKYSVDEAGSAFLEVDADGKISLTLPKDAEGNLLSGQEFKDGASKFIQDAMTHPYTLDGRWVSTTTAVITAESEDGRMADQCNLRVNLIYEDMEMAEKEQDLNVKIRALNRQQQTYDISKFDGKVDFNIHSQDPEDTVTFTSSDPIVTVNNDGSYSLVVPGRAETNWTGENFLSKRNDFVKAAMAAPGVTQSRDVVLTAETKYSHMKDTVTIHVNLTYEEVSLDQSEANMTVTMKATGSAEAPEYSFSGDTSLNLRSVISSIDLNNTGVTYESSNPDILTVDKDGNVSLTTPRYGDHARFMEEVEAGGNKFEFIKEALKFPYEAGKSDSLRMRDVKITVRDENGQEDECTIHVAMMYENLTVQNKDVTMNLTLRAKDLEGKEYELVGSPVSVAANLHSPTITGVAYESLDTDLLSVDEDGMASLVLPESMSGDAFLDGASEFLKDAMNHPYDPTDDDPQDTITRKVTVRAKASDGSMSDTCTVTINLRYEKMQLTPDIQELNVKIRAVNRDRRMYEIEGYTGKMGFTINSQYPDNDTATFTLADPEDGNIIKLNEDGSYSLILPDKESTGWYGDAFDAQANDFIKEALSHPATKEDPYVTTRDIRLNAVSEYQDMKDSAIVRVNVTYEEVVLNQNETTMDIKLKATGPADDPVYELTGTTASLESVINSGNLNNKKVRFESSDPDILKVDNDGNITFNMPYYMDSKSFMEQASSFIKDGMKRPYMPGTDEYIHKADVVITVYDETGILTDQCTVHVNMLYENLVMKNKEVTMKLRLRANNLYRKEFEVVGDPVSVMANLNSDVYGKLVFSSSDDRLMTVDENGMAYITLPESMSGDAFMNGINDFLKDAMLHPYDKKNPYICATKAVATAATEDGTMLDTCTVNFELIYENTDLVEAAKTIDVVVTATGYYSNPSYTVSGNTVALSTLLQSTETDEHGPVYSSSDPSILSVSKDGKVTVVLPGNAAGAAFTDKANAFLKEALAHPYTTASPYIASRTIFIKSTNGEGDLADECPVRINLRYVNNTTSYSSGGGGGGGSSSGGGGGGGGSSKGVTAGGTTTKTTSSLPSYVLKGGTWVQNTEGKWLYTNERTYTDEWAAVHNPYADTSKGQPEYDWFHFGADSFMTTGWYTDKDGDTYFLHNVSDNTLGHMYTGWNWIDDNGDGIYEYYYFETESNGRKGRLYTSTNVGGYMVNEKGQWVDASGNPVTRTADQIKAQQANVPEFVVVDGKWSQDSQGRWSFEKGRRYANEWAAVFNPYADASKGQPAYDWFYFDADGFMKTGWYTDKSGDMYFLHDVSDNTLGHMYTGWNWIDDNGDGVYECYYFETKSNGRRGRLYKSTTVEGYTVNEKGQWVQNGKVMTRTN